VERLEVNAVAAIEYWIQLENRAWDTAPRNLDRLSGQSIQTVTGQAPVSKTITSPMTGASRTVTMNLPADGDALILRRYQPPQLADKSDAWTVPDDRKVNPWDLNEPDPTDNGTMGTIPGATIEANVGDSVVVHFRNRDVRTDAAGDLLDAHERAHSLHTHGFVFENRYDGAYPLSPPDPTQPVGAEGPLWALVGVTGPPGAIVNKKGDRVPAPDPSVPGVPHGGTFDYQWNTFGWPTTAGVWHYHDHSICDMENINAGAIGFVVIHNPADPDDVVGDPSVATTDQPVQELPGGSFNGSPVRRVCFPPPFDIPVLPVDLDRFLEAHPPRPGRVERVEGGHPEGPGGGHPGMEARATEGDAAGAEEAAEYDEEAAGRAVTIERGDLLMELDADLVRIARFCIPFYRDPPEYALYLQLYHELPGVQMLINGRKYLGNAPTVVGGPSTKMRFGLVGMNMAMFHTFHLHGHRWVIPGPSGDHPGGGNGPNAIQNSPLVQAVSQFEDTKLFGPANSFTFTVNQGTFMGAPIGLALGEWHMHCHVLMHMASDLAGGMMGSLLVVQGGALALGLPSGEPCHGAVAPPPQGATVRSTGQCKWRDDTSGTPETTIKVNGTVTWFDQGCSPHTVVSVNAPPFDTLTPALNNPVPAPPTGFSRQFTTVGHFAYICGIHGGDPVDAVGGPGGNPAGPGVDSPARGMWGIVHVIP
jgi:FtsP/CotA-like multicopper oxidase with cupredoxin domain